MKLVQQQQQQQQHASNLNGQGQPPEKKIRVAGSYTNGDPSTYDYQVKNPNNLSLRHIRLSLSREMSISHSKSINNNNNNNSSSSSVFNAFIYHCILFSWLSLSLSHSFIQFVDDELFSFLFLLVRHMLNLEKKCFRLALKNNKRKKFVGSSHCQVRTVISRGN